MRIFGHKNVGIILLFITATIDASRLFDVPLPKFHHGSKSSPILSGSKEDKFINDKEKSFSSVEHNRYKEEDEDEKQDAFDWEALVDKQPSTKHRINVNERLPESRNELDYLKLLNDETEKRTKTKLDDSDDENIDKISKSVHANEDSNVDTASSRIERLQLDPYVDSSERKKRRNDAVFLFVVGTCSFVGILGLVAAAIFWYRIQKRAEAAADSEYPSYGITGPMSSGGGKISPSSTMSDRKLAQSAQMFHYQQQRQQMIAQEKERFDAQPIESDDSDDETPAGGDYTVYECPGLAPTGEMEVRNPLFAEPDSSLNLSPTSSHPTTNNHYPQLSTSPTNEKSLP